MAGGHNKHGGRGRGGDIKRNPKTGEPLNFGNYRDGRLIRGGGKGRGGRGGGGGRSSKTSSTSHDWRAGSDGADGENTARSSQGGDSSSRGGRGGSGAASGRKKGQKGGQQQPQLLPRPLAPKPGRDDPAAVTVGMHESSEDAIRSALQSSALLGNAGEAHFHEKLTVGQSVQAYYEDEAESGWFSARVLALDAGGRLVHLVYTEYGDEATVAREEVRIVSRADGQAVYRPPAARSKEVGGGGGTRQRHIQTSAPRVPPRPAGSPYRAQREALPVFKYRQQVLDAIERYQVVVIEGDTGCGKSTQLPQYVLEAAADAARPCHVVCTQPRRISAMGVADRVAAERGERVGGVVGYSIRLENKTSAQTSLLFCTTGILMRRLSDETDEIRAREDKAVCAVGDAAAADAVAVPGANGGVGTGPGRLQGITHLFVDEVHERSMESDFLLMVLRDVLRERPDLKLILMSATLDAGLFASYFSTAALAQPVPVVPAPTLGNGRTSASARPGGGSARQQHRPRNGATSPQRYGEPAPVISIPGRTFPVAPLFLEDALELTGHRVRPRADWARKVKGGGGAPAGGVDGGGRDHRFGNSGVPPQPKRGSSFGDGLWGPGDPAVDAAADDGVPDMELSFAHLCGRYSKYKVRTQEALAALDHAIIDYELMADLILWLHAQPSETSFRMLNAYMSQMSLGTGRGVGESQPGDRPSAEEPLRKPGDGEAILVFLPGLKEIQTLHEMLLDTRQLGGEPQRSWIVPLHSTLPPEDQRRVFDRPPASEGARKVVLATNIAETAITVDDVGFVIDCGRMKETRYDATRRMESLDEVQVSRANAKQRRGRAGRVRPGVCFHLFTRHAHERVMAPQQSPEVCRVPLDRLVLTIKALRYPGTAAEVCANLIEPPSPDAVRRAVLELEEIDALEIEEEARPDVGCAGPGSKPRAVREELTPLGCHLAKLPVDVRIGKLLLLGAIFGVADEALTVAASMSFRTPFLTPFEKRAEADAARHTFRAGQSDHLTVLRAYREFDRAGTGRFQFARDNFLSVRTLQSIAQLKRQLLELLSDCGFVRPGLRARTVEALGRRDVGSDGCRSAILGGLDTLSGMGSWRDRRGPEENAAATKAAAEVEADLRRDDDLDGATGELVKSLLCAALYPQIIVVEEPPAGKKTKSGMPKAPKFLVREEGSADPVAVQIHPSSVNAKETCFASKYLVFAEKVKTGAVWVRDCAPVNPYALLLFAGILRSEAGARIGGHSKSSRRRSAPAVSPQAETVLCVDWWMRFRVPDRVAALILDARTQLDALLKVKIARPELELSATGRELLRAVTELLATPGNVSRS